MYSPHPHDSPSRALPPPRAHFVDDGLTHVPVLGHQLHPGRIAPGVVGVGWGGAPVTQLPGARKFETLGQRNDATVAGLAAAVDFHERIGEDRIEARVLELTTALYDGMRGMRGAQMVTPARPEMRAGVCIVRFEGREARPLHEALYREHQIATAPTGGLRFSPHVYNTLQDVERALSAVRNLTARSA